MDRSIGNFIIGLITGLILLSLTEVSHAKNFCFVKAVTYYEQTYCEVSAKGYGRHLPDFLDFRKNDPLIQALLLKNPALRSGIALVIPKRKSRSRPKTHSPLKAAYTSNKNTVRKPSTWSSECNLNKKTITCANAIFKLTGNKNNNKLMKGALSNKNKMGLSTYRQSLGNRQAVNTYLIASYQRYLEKMLEIGLGGVTMSSGKFAFLFQDLTDRELSFSKRFETMYHHLRKDKANIRVDERISISHAIRIEKCLNLSNEIISCASAQENLLFVKVI